MDTQRFCFEDFSEEGNDKVIKPATSAPFSALTSEEMRDEPPPQPQTAPVFSKDDIDRTRREAFAQGKNEGYEQGKKATLTEMKSAQESTEKLLASLLENLHGKLNTFFSSIETETKMPKTEILIHLSLEIAKKIAKEALEDNALTVIENFVRKSLEILFDEPHLTIFVPEKLCEPLHEKIDQLTREQNFHGHLKIQPDSSLEPSDCRIEWHDGYIHHTKAAILEHIKKILGADNDNMCHTEQ